MSELLQQVSVDTKANVYFEGKVTSRIVYLEDGQKVTLGIILPGQYTFPVGDKEIVTVTAGEVSVLLPGTSAWETVATGEAFTVIANSEYQIKTEGISEYLCKYVKENG